MRKGADLDLIAADDASAVDLFVDRGTSNTADPPLSRSCPPRRQQRRRSTSAATLSISADVAALVAFSALPFLGVQALADSGAGKKLKEDLEKRKPALLKVAAEAERRRQQAASEETRLFGAARGRWLPRDVSDSLGDWAAAPHLPGEAAGDCGFDPLGLCRRTEEGGWAGTQQQRQRQQHRRQSENDIEHSLESPFEKRTATGPNFIRSG